MTRLLLLLTLLLPQSTDQVRGILKDLVTPAAVTGHEERLAAQIADRLRQRGLAAKVDAMSNVTVTIGSGKPHRLLVSNIDEPGYIVSGITDDGFLRMQRVGTTKAHTYFDQYFEGQRLSITTTNSKVISGVSAIPSQHLARGANRQDRPFELTDAYIDVGAKSAKDVSELGIRVLDPISIEKSFTSLSQDRVSGPFLSDRAGAAALLALLTTMPISEIKGTLTIAFTAQEHFGRKGLDRMSAQFEPDEVYILEALDDPQKALPNTPSWKNGTKVTRVPIPIMFYATPVEVLDLKDLQSTIRFLRNIVQSGVS